MKKLNVTGEGIKELSLEESKKITGGGGGGGLSSFLLGVTIFGMARLCGVMVGYSSL